MHIQLSGYDTMPILLGFGSEAWEHEINSDLV